MKITRNIKNTLTLIMAIFMFVACMPMSALATDVNNTFENVEIGQDEIQPRNYRVISYPRDKVLNEGFNMRRLYYVVKNNNTNKFVLIRLINRANPSQYHTYSLAGTSGELKCNIEAGVYDISVVGGSNTNYETITLTFYEN